jgi:hypothetical protein
MQTSYKAHDDWAKSVFSAFVHFCSQIPVPAAAILVGRGSTKNAQLIGLNHNSATFIYAISGSGLPNFLKWSHFCVAKQRLTKASLAVAGYAAKLSDAKAHINSVDNFWASAKMRLAKFRGLSRNHAYNVLRRLFRYEHNIIFAFLGRDLQTLIALHDSYFRKF